MRVNIVSKQITVTDGIREYVEKKMHRIEKYFGDANSDITVTLTVQKNTQTAEVLVHAKGLHLKGIGKSEDLYASLDFAIDKIERQVSKYKDRLNDRKQNAGAAGLRMSVYEAASMDSNNPEVLISKEFPGEQMNVESAVAIAFGMATLRC